MKSVKSKLFIGYISIIFFILSLLSIVSIYFFQLNQENKSYEFIDSITSEVENFILDNNQTDFASIEQEIELKNHLLIILKKNKLIFSNKSEHKTSKILNELFEEISEGDFEEELSEKGYVEIEDVILMPNYIEKNGEIFEFYIGIDEHLFEGSLEDTYEMVIFSNVILFLILSLSGYLLIHKTIKPLKLILEELKNLQISQDLSLRLKQQTTNDEFQALTHSFNSLLEGIENSVENIKQFSSDASHELKTPLTIIQGEIELCKNSEKSKEELMSTFHKIDCQQKHLQEIIQNFLLLSRLDKEVFQNKTAVLDKVLFDSIESSLEAIENKNLELKVDIEENLIVNFDEKYLSIVLDNLLTNAIKYTNEGFIGVSAQQEGNTVFVRVSDSGMGISKDDTPKIFERFFRVDKARTDMKKGIGLGLAIVKNICSKFNCDIEVKSELNKGTVFTLKINAQTKK